ncbi:arylsulfatase [Prolixibacteraceae bacterium]|nr:arylsulfatase [Prolixibacteraceae bacterium]
MSRHKLLPVVLFLFLFNFMVHGKGDNRRPNVILILTDDQGYGDLACHGNPIIKTPNLDKLHGEAIRLTDFHVNPFCSPTRSAFMTGRLSDRNHVRSTVYARNHLNIQETIMPEFFKASGYRTGQFGKWHLGHNYPYRPMDRGFDSWVGHGDGGTGSASDYWGNDRMNDTYIRNGKLEKFEGFGTDNFFNEAMDFIKESKKKPFFIYLATNVPHKPWNVKKEWYDAYDDIDSTKYKKWLEVRDFYATITNLDKNIGRLRKFLKDNGLDENTIVIFSTDNGTSGGSTVFNAGMRGRKGSMFDGGHRVPLFIHWPKGNLDKGKDITEFTAHVDILPTLIDLCDLKTPKKGHLKFDGVNLAPLVKGEQDTVQDRYLIMHQQNTIEVPIKNRNSLVATKQWRLLDRDKLYKIKDDPSQQNNVAEKYPEIVKLLNEVYDKHWDELDMKSYPYPLAVVGKGKNNEIELVPDGWIRDTKNNTWDQSQVNAGVLGSGFWPVKFAKSGMYKFDVRRWPKELNQPINRIVLDPKQTDVYRHGNPVDDYGYGRGLVKGKVAKPLPVVKVQLVIGDEIVEKEVNNKDNCAAFKVNIPKGVSNVRAWLIDRNGDKRGAYYVYISK